MVVRRRCGRKTALSESCPLAALLPGSSFQKRKGCDGLRVHWGSRVFSWGSSAENSSTTFRTESGTRNYEACAERLEVFPINVFDPNRVTRHMRFPPILMVAVCVAFCQSVNQPRGYKAAIVRPYSETDGPPGIAGIPPSPLVLTGFTLEDLIAFAHGGSKFQVIEGPSWVWTDRWNLRLEVEPRIMPTKQHQQILLTALRDRFEMTTHRESKLKSVYELTLADTGSKLKPDDFLVAGDPDRP